MNKEYIYISDEEIIVTDENGHIIKRSIESTDMHNLLLLENNLEEINNKINVLKEKINQNNEIASESIMPKIIAYSSPLIVSLIGYGCTSIFTDMSNYFIEIISAGTLASVTLIPIIHREKRNTKEQLNEYKKELETAIKLKEKYKKDINHLKNLTKKDNEKDIIQTSTSISLNTQNISTYDTSHLNKSYNQDAKKLVLRRKSDNKR